MSRCLKRKKRKYYERVIPTPFCVDGLTRIRNRQANAPGGRDAASQRPQLRMATDFKKILMVFGDGRVGMLTARNQFARAASQENGSSDSQMPKDRKK